MQTDLLEGWSDSEKLELLNDLLQNEKGRCCRIRPLTTDFSGPCDASVSRLSYHEQQSFLTVSMAAQWINERWKQLVQNMKSN